VPQYAFVLLFDPEKILKNCYRIHAHEYR